ncbi:MULTISPECIES: hypothetical protein [Bacteroides]|uniref:hypothetical protein n=1 Tax=Bacteroides TaxID=816 RepID=UPI00319DAE36
MNRMIVFLLFTLACHVNATHLCAEGKSHNLFNYGFKLENTRSNFENLFRNYPLCIENADKIDLMYYRYVGTLKNKRQIRHYIKRNYPPYVPSWGISGETGSDSRYGDYSIIRYRIENEPFSWNPEFKSMMDKLENEYVHVGYEVWEVVFRLWDKQYHYYVFADPATKQVVSYGNLFCISFSDKHIQYMRLRKLYGLGVLAAMTYDSDKGNTKKAYAKAKKEDPVVAQRRKADQKMYDEAYFLKESEIKVANRVFQRGESTKPTLYSIERGAKETKVTFMQPIYSNWLWVHFSPGMKIVDRGSGDEYPIKGYGGGLPFERLLVVKGHNNQYIFITLIFPKLKESVRRIDILELPHEKDILPSNDDGIPKSYFNINVEDYLVSFKNSKEK